MSKLMIFLLIIGIILIMVGLAWWGNSISAFDEIYLNDAPLVNLIGFLIPFGIGCVFIGPGIFLILKNFKNIKK